MTLSARLAPGFGLALALGLVLGLAARATLAASDGLETVKVAENVYAVVGELGNRTRENFGNNATFGFVVTGTGVVLIDSGGTRKGAARLQAAIRRVTDRPVTVVLNTGGQDHRWLGNGHFRAQGARIVAHRRAVADQKARLKDQFFVLGNLVGAEGLAGTEPVHADPAVEAPYRFSVGGVAFELHHAGAAHTPGDAFVWLPGQKIVFAGDIVYTERMLAVLEVSNSRTWLAAFDRIAALEPRVVVPGHGRPTTLARARADTRDYLAHLRAGMAKFMKAGGKVTRTREVDQSAFRRLANFDTLAGRNAQRVFEEMEWE